MSSHLCVSKVEIKYLIHVNQYRVNSMETTLQSWAHTFQKESFICFNESPIKMMKNAFHFIFKALFVLKICKFLC